MVKPQKMAAVSVPTAIMSVFTMSRAKYGDGQNESGAKMIVAIKTKNATDSERDDLLTENVESDSIIR
jgi:hypothetical protein